MGYDTGGQHKLHIDACRDVATNRDSGRSNTPRLACHAERLEQPRVRSQVVGGDAWQHGLTPNFGGTAELAAAVTSAPIVHADINDGTLLRYGTAGAADERYVARVQMYMVGVGGEFLATSAGRTRPTGSCFHAKMLLSWA